MLVDGVWSAWEDWNCDNGQCERSRACSEPMHEGLDTCGGADTDLEVGTIHDCLCPGGNDISKLQPFCS